MVGFAPNLKTFRETPRQFLGVSPFHGPIPRQKPAARLGPPHGTRRELPRTRRRRSGHTSTVGAGTHSKHGDLCSCWMPNGGPNFFHVLFCVSPEEDEEKHVR